MTNEELIEELKQAGGYQDDRGNRFYKLPSEAVCRKAVQAIEQLVKERDAAVEDVKLFADCDVCKNNNDECLNNGLCKACSVGKSTREYWEWRGVTE